MPTLDALVDSSHTVVAVVSGTDKRRGRGNDLMPTVVKKRALEHGIPVIEADNMRDPAFEEQLKALDADLFVVVAFKILPPVLLKIPKIGSVNLHASLLPRYRGAAPIHWAVINGDTETGVTVFFLDEKVDTGKYLFRERTEIKSDDTTGDVYDRLMLLGAEVMVRAVDTISSGKFELHAQNDAEATSAPKIFPEDAYIRLDKYAVDIVNLVRGMNPFPVAWLMIDEKKLKVFKAMIPDDEDKILGQLSDPDYKRLVVVNGRLFAYTRSELIEFIEVQIEGKRRTTASEFIRGYQGELRITESI